MVRRLIFYFEIALVCVLQLFWVACAIGAVLQAVAHAKPAGRNAPTAITMPVPPQFGAFLTALPGGPQLSQAVHLPELERPIRDDPSRFFGHRFYRHKAVDRTLPIIHTGFESECRAHGGVTSQTPDDQIVFRKMLRAERAGMFPGEQFVVTTCRDAGGSILAANIIITANSIGIYKRTGVFVMKGAVANPAYAASVAAIAAERAAAERAEAEYQIVAARAAKRNAEENLRIARWQKTLAVGDATHCGYVIEVRGRVVQVALRSRTAWVPREALLPHEKGYHCRAYDEHSQRE